MLIARIRISLCVCLYVCGPRCFKRVKRLFRRKKVHRVGLGDANSSEDEDVVEKRERSVVFVNMVPRVFGSGEVQMEDGSLKSQEIV